MKQLFLLFFLLLLLSIVSCSKSREPLFEGQCVQEINKEYLSADKESPWPIYRIEKVLDESYVISTWSNKSWLFLQEKPLSYFDESRYFSYQKATCPDKEIVQQKSINSIVKDIEIH